MKGRDFYMGEFIKLLDQDYELVQYRIKDRTIIFHIQSSKEELKCPFCGSKSVSVHSVYQREIQDLPIQDKQVILLVHVKCSAGIRNALIRHLLKHILLRHQKPKRQTGWSEKSFILQHN